MALFRRYVTFGTRFTRLPIPLILDGTLTYLTMLGMCISDMYTEATKSVSRAAWLFFRDHPSSGLATNCHVLVRIVLDV